MIPGFAFAEQKARTTYEHLIQLTDDPGIKDTYGF